MKFTLLTIDPKSKAMALRSTYLACMGELISDLITTLLFWATGNTLLFP